MLSSSATSWSVLPLSSARRSANRRRSAPPRMVSISSVWRSITWTVSGSSKRRSIAVSPPATNQLGIVYERRLDWVAV